MKTLTHAEWDALIENGTLQALIDKEPVRLLRADGSPGMIVSCGYYPKPNDCEWCQEDKETCGILSICAGRRLRKLEAALVCISKCNDGKGLMPEIAQEALT